MANLLRSSATVLNSQRENSIPVLTIPLMGRPMLQGRIILHFTFSPMLPYIMTVSTVSTFTLPIQGPTKLCKLKCSERPHFIQIYTWSGWLLAQYSWICPGIQANLHTVHGRPLLSIAWTNISRHFWSCKGNWRTCTDCNRLLRIIAQNRSSRFSYTTLPKLNTVKCTKMRVNELPLFNVFRKYIC